MKSLIKINWPIKSQIKFLQLINSFLIVLAKSDKIMSTMPPIEFPGYVNMLVSSYAEFSGVLTYRHSGKLSLLLIIINDCF